jgi:uncharacterized protein
MVEGGPVVSNASPLVGLARIGRLDLLRSLFGTILVPTIVWSELTAKESPDTRLLMCAQAEGWLVLQDQADRQGLPVTLDAGEAEAIALASSLSSSLLLMDEALGRKAARAAGCEVMGTLGVLALAKKKGLVSVVAPLVAQLQASSFRVAPGLVDTLLRSLGEIK